MEDVATEAAIVLHPTEEEKETPQEEESHDEGLINHILSNLVSKGEAHHDDGENQHHKKPELKAEEKGGILDHLISTLASSSPKAQEKAVHQEPLNKVNGEEEEDGGGGGSIIDNIVSHFPKSLPDDAAPTTEEASILIHSLVHD